MADGLGNTATYGLGNQRRKTNRLALYGQAGGSADDGLSQHADRAVGEGDAMADQDSPSAIAGPRRPSPPGVRSR
ncbi:hypothetical protein [Amycolatopsis thermoflava]|uniref:Uncharacterized protein n=1 Tax=Amycolatopsis thermoflava TaxID=84480 RepID=A0A3N2H5I3_9PSEU|nr:hypothetical protein [Amycolatopsis thermoflava]ROS43365.1 hypothetical protein EDD35_5776 [Amycolatopsis thermoflava]